MKTNVVPVEFLERLKEIEKENNFFNALEDVGFEVKRNIFFFEGRHQHHIKHYILPLSSGFFVDFKSMNVTWMTLDAWEWVEPKEKGKPIITCENFVKYWIHRVRLLTNEIVSKLDNRRL
jgi:hypothetical protein